MQARLRQHHVVHPGVSGHGVPRGSVAGLCDHYVPGVSGQYACAYICMCVCMRVRIYVCVYVCMHVRVFACIIVRRVEDFVDHLTPVSAWCGNASVVRVRLSVRA